MPTFATQIKTNYITLGLKTMFVSLKIGMDKFFSMDSVKLHDNFGKLRKCFIISFFYEVVLKTMKALVCTQIY